MSDAPQETEVPVEEVETNSDITKVAQEVIAGRWGRGNTRKQRLKDAGFDPVVVQEEVRKLFNQS